MKKLIASLICSVAIAAATPIPVSFVNVGTPGVLDNSRDYVGPYTLTVNGKNMAAMCMDDFLNTSGSWTANVTMASSSDLSNTYLGNKTYSVNGYQYSSAQIYQSEVYLFSKIIQPGADRIDLQDTAWTIMDYVTGHTPHSSSTDAAVNSILADVMVNAGSFNTSGYELVSQVNPGTNAEQEFVIATPEPASCALMGAALLLLGMTRQLSRKRSPAALAESATE